MIRKTTVRAFGARRITLLCIPSPPLPPRKNLHCSARPVHYALVVHNLFLEGRPWTNKQGSCTWCWDLHSPTTKLIPFISVSPTHYSFLCGYTPMHRIFWAVVSIQLEFYIAGIVMHDCGLHAHGHLVLVMRMRCASPSQHDVIKSQT